MIIDKQKKKLAAGAVAGVAALALISGGTFALWSDFDSIEGNELAAGTLTLDLGEQTSFAVGNLAPGENKAQEVYLVNRSDETAALENARLTGSILGLAPKEDGCVGNSEIVDDADCNDTSSGGEFHKQARIQFAWKPASDAGQCGGGGYPSSGRTQGVIETVAANGPFSLGTVNPGEGICVRIEAGLPGGPSGGDDNDGIDFGAAGGNAINNAAQGDSVEFDLRFDLTQSIPNEIPAP